MSLTADSKNGAGVSYAFTFDGVLKDWGNALHKIKDLNNSAEPVNKKRKIADINASFIDIDASIWTELGGGTTAFNKSFSCKVSVGGTLIENPTHIGTNLVFGGTTGASDFDVFQGEIDNVSRAGRITSIHARNDLRYLGLLEWQQPILGTWGNLTGASGSTADSTLLSYDWLKNESGFNESDDKTSFNFNAILNTGTIPLGSYLGTGIYDTSPDGIQPMLDSLSSGTYQFVDSLFYIEYPITELRFNSNGKIEWPGGTANKNVTHIYPLKKIRLQGSPIGVLRHCLFGKMVSDFLDESISKGPTFTEARRITAFKNYVQTINPTESNVKPALDNLLQTEQSLFYVSNDNKFEIEPYGPKDLSQDLPVLGSSDLLKSSTSNDLKDYFNRIQIKFNYDFDKDIYQNTVSGTQDDWTLALDNPLLIESKWVSNGNQANATLSRIMARYKNTSPKISITTPLNKTGLELGTLLRITDINSSLNDTVVQVTDYKKKLSTSKNIDFTGWNGDSLFKQRGYARWTDTTGTVNGSSIGGWGTLFHQSGGEPFTGINGTVHNINETLYGTVFNLW